MRACVVNCLDAANSCGLRSIAFPAISMGMGGFPKEKCGNIMIQTCIEWGSIHHNENVERIAIMNWSTAEDNLFKVEFNKIKR